MERRFDPDQLEDFHLDMNAQETEPGRLAPAPPTGFRVYRAEGLDYFGGSFSEDSQPPLRAPEQGTALGQAADNGDVETAFHLERTDRTRMAHRAHLNIAIKNRIFVSVDEALWLNDLVSHCWDGEQMVSDEPITSRLKELSELVDCLKLRPAPFALERRNADDLKDSIKRAQSAWPEAHSYESRVELLQSIPPIAHRAHNSFSNFRKPKKPVWVKAGRDKWEYLGSH